ncbi:hypothetical protein [Myroides sp. LJL119]
MKISTYIFKIIFFVGICFSLTSCFDFIEDITIKNNGSGHIKATLNISQSKTKLASVMNLESIYGYKIPSKEKVEQTVQEIVSLLENTPGITNVNYTLDLTNFIATLSCDFSNIKALNVFSKTIEQKFGSKLQLAKSYQYDTQKKVFTRSYNYDPSFSKALEKFDLKDKDSFNSASYTQIFRFQQAIKSSNNPSANVSGNKQNVMLKQKVVDLLDGKAVLSNTIEL